MPIRASTRAVVVVVVAAISVGWTLADRPTVSDPAAEVRMLLDEGRTHEALIVARRLHAARPDDPQHSALLGAVSFRAGRLGEVEAALGAALAGDPVPLEALVTLARLRHAEGRAAEAQAVISRALDRAPDDLRTLYWAGELSGDRLRSLELLRRYLRLAADDDPERVEAAEGAVRVYEALGETPVWFDRERPDSLDVPLRRIWDPATGVVQGYVVQVRLGERRRRVPLLLDSGSPGLYVIDRTADRRGFRPLAERTVFGGGGEGRHRTRRGLFDSFALEGLAFGNALATATPDELDPVGRYHGLLGVGIFAGHRASLDLDRGRLRLEPSTGSDRSGRPYWVVGGQLLVEVTVESADGRAEQALFLLDTGATRSLVSLELAGRLGGATLGRDVELHGFGGRRAARVLDGVEIVFGDARSGQGSTRAVDLSRRSRLGGVEVAGFLGLDALDGRVLVIDGPARRVRLVAPPRRGR